MLYKYIYTSFINQYFHRQTIEFFINVYRRLLLILHLVFSLRTWKVSQKKVVNKNISEIIS